MKLKNHLLASAVLCSAVSLVSWAQEVPYPKPMGTGTERPTEHFPRQNDPSPTALGAEKPFHQFTRIHVKNLQNESLGRITDLGIDLTNGRIVQVLVLTNDKKIVGVPPSAFTPDSAGEVYRLDISASEFNNSPAITLDRGNDWGRSDKVGAAYRHFKQEPYFSEEGATATPGSRVALGQVERSSRIQQMPVGNSQGVMFGKVWSLTYDINAGRVDNVIILAPGNFQTKTVVVPSALTFNANRDALVLDLTKEEFANEPRYVYTAPSYGQQAYSEEESSSTSKQGKIALAAAAVTPSADYRDVDRTYRINQDIRAAKVNGQNVEVTNVNGRIVLRGWVLTEADKVQIGEIAVAASSREMVDNQITVGRPVS